MISILGEPSRATPLTCPTGYTLIRNSDGQLLCYPKEGAHRPIPPSGGDLRGDPLYPKLIKPRPAAMLHPSPPAQVQRLKPGRPARPGSHAPAWYYAGETVQQQPIPVPVDPYSPRALQGINMLGDDGSDDGDGYYVVSADGSDSGYDCSDPAFAAGTWAGFRAGFWGFAFLTAVAGVGYYFGQRKA